MVVCVDEWTLRGLVLCIVVLWVLFCWKCGQTQELREESDRLRSEAARRNSALEVARFNLRNVADWNRSR